MVKGITRRVIVVKTPDPRYFEEAIFIVKEDVSVSGVDAHALLQEAQTVAAGFVKAQSRTGRIWGKIPPFVYVAAGAVISGILMLGAGLVF